jgi:hypothetical protein
MPSDPLHRSRSRSLISLFLAATACGPTSNTDTGQTSSSTTSVGGTTSSAGNTTGQDPTTTATTATTTTTTTTETSLASTDPDKQFRCNQCDEFLQNCPPGQKCTAWANNGGSAWNATKCVDVTGTKGPGEECTAEGGAATGIDDCQKGAMCWYVNKDTNMGTCVALCTGTPDAPVCDPGFDCALASDGVLNLCLPKCDPLLQDCPGDYLCIPSYDDDFICVVDASGDPGKTNDPCEFINSCDKGLACSPTATASSACMQDATGCCQPFCDFSMMEPCPNPDQKCVQWFNPMLPIPPGFEDIGICAIPT